MRSTRRQEKQTKHNVCSSQCQADYTSRQIQTKAKRAVLHMFGGNPKPLAETGCTYERDVIIVGLCVRPQVGSPGRHAGDVQVGSAALCGRLGVEGCPGIELRSLEALRLAARAPALPLQEHQRVDVLHRQFIFNYIIIYTYIYIYIYIYYSFFNCH